MLSRVRSLVEVVDRGVVGVLVYELDQFARWNEGSQKAGFSLFIYLDRETRSSRRLSGQRRPHHQTQPVLSRVNCVGLHHSALTWGREFGSRQLTKPRVEQGAQAPDTAASRRNKVIRAVAPISYFTHYILHSY